MIITKPITHTTRDPKNTTTYKNTLIKDLRNGCITIFYILTITYNYKAIVL